MIEIGGGERRVPGRREPPRAIIEAFAGDVDIVAVQHAMDEPGRHVPRRQACGAGDDMVEQPHRIVRLLAVKMAQDVADERAHPVLVL